MHILTRLIKMELKPGIVLLLYVCQCGWGGYEPVSRQIVGPSEDPKYTLLVVTHTIN